MAERSSPSGQIRTLSSNPPGAWLWDFDVDGASLKPAHTIYLDTLITLIRATILPAGSAVRWIISITGRTSGTGDADHNMRLSRRRADAVAGYLKDRLKSVPVDFKVDCIGEKGAADNVEDPWPRSVAILALEPLRAVKKEPEKKKDPDKPTPPPLPDRLFVVRITDMNRFDVTVSPGSMRGRSSSPTPKAGPSVSAGVTRMSIRIQILDLEERRAASYHFSFPLLMGRATLISKPSPSVPGPWGTSISWSGERLHGKGGWLPFRTEGRSVTVESFANWFARVIDIRANSIDLLLSPSLFALRGTSLNGLRKPFAEGPQLPSAPSQEILVDLLMFGFPLVPVGKATPWKGPTPLDDLVKQLHDLKDRLVPAG